MKIKLGSTASSISKLKDVDLTNLSDGKVLQYNAALQTWEAVTVNAASGNVSEFDDLSDVQVVGATSGQILQFNGLNWIPVNNDRATLEEAKNEAIKYALILG